LGGQSHFQWTPPRKLASSFPTLPKEGEFCVTLASLQSQALKPPLYAFAAFVGSIGDRGGVMALRFQVGDTFPSVSLVDERGEERTIAELSGGQPLLLIFFRGPW